MKETETFCLDTSVFINSWRKHYHPDVFPSYWRELEKLIDGERVCSCREVLEELQYQDDELTDWAKQKRHIFHEPTSDVLMEMSLLMRAYPNMAAAGKFRNAADPWVIVQAKYSRATLVTYENLAEKPKPTVAPKIPNVCADMGIPCIGVLDFLRRVGIRI